MFNTIVDSLDIFTIVIPPALPAALSVGKYYAQSRLQKQKITCVNSSVINVSGSVNCVCFDKVSENIHTVYVNRTCIKAALLGLYVVELPNVIIKLVFSIPIAPLQHQKLKTLRFLDSRYKWSYMVC